VLSAKNRLRNSSDFSRTTKTGHRATSPHLVLYFLSSAQNHDSGAPKLGLIINKSIGGSVTRHQIARQLRHIARERINTFPENTHMVIRVLKKCDSYQAELNEAFDKALTRLTELAGKK